MAGVEELREENLQLEFIFFKGDSSSNLTSGIKRTYSRFSSDCGSENEEGDEQAKELKEHATAMASLSSFI